MNQILNMKNWMIRSEWSNNSVKVHVFTQKFVFINVTEEALHIKYIWFYLQYWMKNVDMQHYIFPSSHQKIVKFIAQLSFWIRAGSLDLLWSQNTNETKYIHFRLDLMAACFHLSFSRAPSQWKKTKLQPDMNKQMQTNMTNQKGSRWR